MHAGICAGGRSQERSLPRSPMMALPVYVGREDRPSNPLIKPTLTAGGPPVRIAYEVQPDERHPQRILILAIGAKPDIYDDAAARR